jgi:transposase InsO family protein
MVKDTIAIYNNERLHLSLNYQTPAMKHQSEGARVPLANA